MTREQKINSLMALEAELFRAFWCARMALGNESTRPPTLMEHLDTVRVKLRLVSVVLDELDKILGEHVEKMV